MKNYRGQGVEDSRGQVPPLARLNPEAKRYSGANIFCQVHKDKIDISVCAVRSIRQPEKCKGCPVNL